MSDIPTATLQPKEERRLQRGHLWAFRNEFKQLPQLADGAVVDIFAANRRFIARGFFQANGGIGVRVLSGHQEEIDAAFFAARVQAARNLRRTLFPGSHCYRWVFGESDGLPGLVADRYGSVVIAESTCAFYVAHAQQLAESFLEGDGVDGFRLRVNNATYDFGHLPETVSFEVSGLTLEMQPAATQKTGLYLDQRLNRVAIAPFVRNARVLDGHCYHGLWACHAALAGAREVLAVDTSAAAIAQAQANAARNGVAERCTFREADIEAVLAEMTKPAFEVVIVDPPAFAKGRTQVAKALPRYRALNAAAMNAVVDGGILVSCSCSHFVSPEDFVDMLKQAAAHVRRRVTLLELRGAAPDHPVLLSMPETNYLKCAILRVG